MYEVFDIPTFITFKVEFFRFCGNTNGGTKLHNTILYNQLSSVIQKPTAESYILRQIDK